ncbi:hypothetical protein DL93DRAFT_2073542 [Clavulina sp. PMI_390]|nr:hypothetical protein DL93DRAFT_2073542 [Clavulina sp. PMI_390]
MLRENARGYPTLHSRWLGRYRTNVKKFEASFHLRLGGAFKSLQQLTAAILECTDEELNAVVLAPHASDVVRHIRLATEAFRVLSQTATATLAELCDESQSVMAWETRFYRIRDSIPAFHQSVWTELESVARTEKGYEHEFNLAKGKYEEYDRKIVEWDRMSVFERVFATNARIEYGPARDVAEVNLNITHQQHIQMRDLREKMEQIARDIEPVLDEPRIDFHSARVEEHRVIDAKKAAMELFSKTCQLENFLLSREIEFSVEDAVRYILQIVYCVIGVVDSDVHVKRFKAQIMGEVVQKYGEKRAEELKQTRK